MRKIIVYCFIMGVFVGCNRHPLKRTSQLAEEGMLPGISTRFVIYDDMLKTGGNLFTYPGGENQTVDLRYTDNPYTGSAALLYAWNGRDVNDTNLSVSRHDFVGLDLVVSQGSDDFDKAQGVDLTLGNYSKLTFWIRGSLSDNTTVKVEAIDDGDTSTTAPVMLISSLSPTWQKKEISLTGASMNAVKEFFKITLVYTQPAGSTTPGNGAIVYIDDIMLEQ